MQRPHTYSAAFRKRALDIARSDGLTDQQAAHRFGIGRATFVRWKSLERATGTPASKGRQAEASYKIDGPVLRQLQHWVEEKPDRTLGELQQLLRSSCEVEASIPTIFRALRRLSFTYKKKR